MIIPPQTRVTAPPYSPTLPTTSPARRYWLARWRLRRWQNWLAKWRARRRNHKALARLAAVGGLLLAFSGPIAAAPPRALLYHSPPVAQTISARVSNFPPVIDLGALNGSDGFRLNGIEAGDCAGCLVSGAGDVNGDGFDDLLIGAPMAAPGGRFAAGESYVVFGGSAFAASLDLSTLDGSNGFRLEGVTILDLSGYSVSAAGDVNGDGFDDLFVGALGADPGGRNYAGESYVVFGAATFAASLNLSSLDGSNGFRLNGIDDNDKSGSAVSAAGDINGDGFDDLLIGAQGGDPGGYASAGESYVVFGRPTFPASLRLSRLNGSTGFRLDGIAADDQSGFAVSGAGDVNGDGFGDLLIGAPGRDIAGASDVGESYVIFGKARFTRKFDLLWLNGRNGFRLEGVSTGDNSGSAVSGAGDINGDGFDDLIIGARGGDAGGDVNAGESYVIFGGSVFAASLNLSTLDGTNGFRLDGVDVGDRSGFAVSRVGDVNGDGFDDLLIGALYADPGGDSDAGESYLVFGGPAFAASLDLAGLDGTNGFRLDGIDADDRSGIAVSGAGDVNSDGVDDLFIGTVGGDPGGSSNAGESYVVFGRSASLSASPSTPQAER